MSKALRSQTWNWIPAFLEVAETGSVTEAARRMHLTPAAVSRTVRLLERELGESLFNRIGRSLVLNHRGANLRDAARSAAMAVDRGLSATLANPFAGALRVASLGVLTDYFVIPCLVQLRREHPALVSEHLNLRTAEATELLARAELDVAFYYEELSVDGVVVERIGSTPTAIYCGRGHPLFSQQRITQRMVLEHPFSIPQIGDSGRVMDGWPSEIPRQVGMRITMLRSNLAVCTAGVLLTVLPDIAAVDGLAAGHLRRISVPALPAIDVFAGRPASGLERGAAQFLVEQVRERLSRKLERRRRRSSTRRNQL